MKRRKFLQTTAAITLHQAIARGADTRELQVVTVSGPTSPKQLGSMLPHEHILVDFIGADEVSAERYNRDEVFDVMLPYLKQLRRAGCRTVAECTPAYLGRDVMLLMRLSDASGLQLVTNTGYYGARRGKYLPPHAFTDSAKALASRWIRESRDGIDGTAVRPGFIKIGVDSGPLTDVNQKLIQAAAICHLETGLTIAAHTGDGHAAVQQVQLLQRIGCPPNRWIWVHAQNEADPQRHRQVAEAGAWVEFDGIAPHSIDDHVKLVNQMRRHGLLNHVLLSHDAGWYSVGESRGGEVRGFTTLFEQFLPALRQAGFSDAEIEQLTVTNPAQAFATAL